MPANISPATLVVPSTLTVPVDGDADNAASVTLPFQKTLDGVEGLRQALYGQATRKSYRCVDGVNITIDPLGRLFLPDATGAWQTVSHTSPTTVAAATLAGSLANHSRYYIYAYINAGVLAFTAVSEAPEDTLSYRATSDRYLYVGTFVTDGAAAVKGFTCYNQNYLYHIIGGNSTTTLPGVSAAVTATYTVLDLDTAGNRGMPPHSRMALLGIELIYASARTAGVQFSITGAGADKIWEETFDVSAAGQVWTQVWVPTMNQQVYYRGTTITDFTMTLALIGFMD